jgi:alanyl-tRNA synthetase
MTERLYYRDSYLTEFSARVMETAEDGKRVYLDRTAFYPSSGGQPFDRGSIGGSAVVDVVDEGERIAHVLATPLAATDVECRVEWQRRFDHMQQHTGQHLLSAVFVEQCAAQTLSFHLGEESCTVDIGVSSLEPAQVRAVERRVNEAVFENLPVTVIFADASQDLGLRKASEREGELRVIDIVGTDRSACGGTHVRATGEIGPVLIRKLDKIRGTVRVEFLCGMRAVSRARADFEALSQVGRTLSASLDEAPACAAAQAGKLNDAEKARKKLSAELAKYEGRELYAVTEAGVDGFHRVVRRIASGAIDDDLRIVAQSFAAQSKAVFTAIVVEPPSVLYCVSTDSGIHAGNVLKATLLANGGRGGGNSQLAQGSVPSREALAAVEAALQ